jgi:hypothetical protein
MTAKPADEDDDDEDDLLRSVDGAIPEQLFPAGKTADLDKAIFASKEKCYIGECDHLLAANVRWCRQYANLNLIVHDGRH